MIVSPVAILIAPRFERKKVIDKKFLVLTSIATGLTIMDFEMTQHCLEIHDCQPGGDLDRAALRAQESYRQEVPGADQHRHRADNHGFRDDAALSRNP